MATISPVKTTLPDLGEYDGVFVYSWTLTSADDAAPLTLPRHADKSVQVAGTFGGATVKIEGSLDGATFAPVTDPQGNDIAITAFPAGYSAKIESVTEAVRSIKPTLSGATGTTAITVTILLRS